jgi:Transcriptional regulator, AbiEi antitoxin
MPGTYGDLWNAYLQYFEALYSRIPRLTAPDAREAIKIVLHQARSLVQMKPLAQRYPTVFRELAQRDQESATGVLETIVSILRYERNHPDREFMSQLEAIYESLVNGSFSTRLRRYAALDLIEDKFNEEGKQEDQAEIAFRGLADEVIANPALLTPELVWLNSTDAKNGYLFGRELGRRDRDLLLWRAIRESWTTSAPRHDFFIGGFLAGLFESDKASWERELRLVAANDGTVSDFPVLLWRSGMSEPMAEQYLDLARTGRVDLRTIRMFVYGAVVRAMPKHIVEDFVGLPREYVQRLADRGALVRVARGLYADPDAPMSAQRSLAEVARAVPNGIVCLLSALKFHRLTTQAHPEVWIALGVHAWGTRDRAASVRARLLNLARQRGEDFQITLRNDLFERFHGPASPFLVGR